MDIECRYCKGTGLFSMMEGVTCNFCDGTGREGNQDLLGKHEGNEIRHHLTRSEIIVKDEEGHRYSMGYGRLIEVIKEEHKKGEING